MKAILLTIYITCLTNFVFANNLAISNLVLNQATQEITVDVRWNNSRRFDGLAAPQNWDAAWFFVKFRACLDCAESLDWIHGTIDGPNSNFGDLQAHSTHAGNQFYTDRLGVMLRRSTTGLFPNQTASTITLKVDNLPTSGGVEIRVVGIEMVYVPQAAFQLGDGNSTTSSRFHAGTSATTVYNVTSENAITFANTAGNLYATGNQPSFCCPAPASYTIPTSFPKGFAGFYMMKYEISQGQYATFLNTVSPSVAAIRYTSNYNTNRNRLLNNGASPNQYFSERQDRAQNFLSPNDILSYLDWAALRPMTELEYEKAARGIAVAVPNEYVWGTIVLNQARDILPYSFENGTETIGTVVNANCSYGSFWYTGGDYSQTTNWQDAQGPLRGGIFADPFDGTREKTGASYYGIMELSGNVSELTVGIIDIQSAPIYSGLYGDGYLGLNGQYNVTNWPSGAGFENNLMYRGGNWSEWTTSYLRTSSRAYPSSDYNSRYSGNGGRGGR